MELTAKQWFMLDYTKHLTFAVCCVARSRIAALACLSVSCSANYARRRSMSVCLVHID